MKCCSAGKSGEVGKKEPALGTRGLAVCMRGLAGWGPTLGITEPAACIRAGGPAARILDIKGPELDMRGLAGILDMRVGGPGTVSMKGAGGVPNRGAEGQ